jgi:hypothetical protein
MVSPLTLPRRPDVSTTQTLAFPEENLIGWERALLAFLVEKQRRSGSICTVQGVRLACLSSFFRFLQRMDIVVSNPCDKLERPRTSTPPGARGGKAERREFPQPAPGTPRPS